MNLTDNNIFVYLNTKGLDCWCIWACVDRGVSVEFAPLISGQTLASAGAKSGKTNYLENRPGILRPAIEN